jgi:hypothetical protein
MSDYFARLVSMVTAEAHVYSKDNEKFTYL